MLQNTLILCPIGYDGLFIMGLYYQLDKIRRQQYCQCSITTLNQKVSSCCRSQFGTSNNYHVVPQTASNWRSLPGEGSSSPVSLRCLVVFNTRAPLIIPLKLLQAHLTWYTPVSIVQYFLFPCTPHAFFCGAMAENVQVVAVPAFIYLMDLA